MKTLFLAPEEEDGDIKGLVPSSFKVKKRIEVAIERREKERLSAIQAAKELRLHRHWPRKAIVQPLSSTWEELVAGAESRDHMKIITKSKEGTELLVKDFATLLGRHAWLNDEIINTYIEWIVLAANEDAVAQAVARGEKPSTVPRFIAHNSFFWENLKKKGAESTERLMKRKKAPGISLMEVDSVFVPICSGNHWTIGVVRPVAKTIEYFDSMGGRPPIFFKKMREWLGFQLGKLYVEGDWTEPRTACAEQTNGYDCGVFVCTNAFCVALGLNTECYKERDMALQRRNIAAVLINKGFSGDFAWSNGDLLH
jgi:Ulp1 family protease